MDSPMVEIRAGAQGDPFKVRALKGLSCDKHVPRLAPFCLHRRNRELASRPKGRQDLRPAPHPASEIGSLPVTRNKP